MRPVKSQPLSIYMESMITSKLPLYIAHTILESVATDICLVGGCVRDLLLGRPINDYDFVCTGDLDEIADAFRLNDWKVSEVGKKFLVMKVSNPGIRGADFDIALYRKDGTYTDGRRPDVTLVGDIFSDSERRDFTINALYIDLKNMTILDPTEKGLDDIRSTTLRFVGKAEKRIMEDYLRVFRAYRFSSTLKFDINPHDLTVIRRLFDVAVQNTAPERIRLELEKMCYND